MCRWPVSSGEQVPLLDLLHRPADAPVVPDPHPPLRAEPTDGTRHEPAERRPR